ncbi:hypothetical protein CL651_000710 [bacterium]|nr:hypothetical protein [bacterium]
MNKMNFNIKLLFQFIASVSWMLSVFVYGLNGFGDYLQLLASTAWTGANILSCFSSNTK